MRVRVPVVGKEYRVWWVDFNYPCDCDCHDPKNIILHIVPCCHDKTYSFIGTHVGMFKDSAKAIVYYLFNNLREDSRPAWVRDQKKEEVVPVIAGTYETIPEYMLEELNASEVQKVET